MSVITSQFPVKNFQLILIHKRTYALVKYYFKHLFLSRFNIMLIKHLYWSYQSDQNVCLQFAK